MKKRLGFVTNSSSTSYIIQMNGQTPKERCKKAFAAAILDDVKDGLLSWFRPNDARSTEDLLYLLRMENNKNPCNITESAIKFLMLRTDGEKIAFISKELSKHHYPRRTKPAGKMDLEFGNDVDDGSNMLNYFLPSQLHKGWNKGGFNIVDTEGL